MNMKLDKEEKNALDSFGSFLQRRLPDAVERVELFGSRARGDSHRESDIDVLVALDTASPSNRDAVYDAVIDTLLDSGIYLSALVYDRGEFARKRAYCYGRRLESTGCRGQPESDAGLVMARQFVQFIEGILPNLLREENK